MWAGEDPSLYRLHEVIATTYVMVRVDGMGIGLTTINPDTAPKERVRRLAEREGFEPSIQVLARITV
jgi:hypothetical protein